MPTALRLLALALLGAAFLLRAAGARADEAKPSLDDAAVMEPDGALRASKSINGKSVIEMRDQVRAVWGDLVFAKDGKPVEYVATILTDAGPIELEFLPDQAPNHVRNFLALSKVGFYDGLIFHRCIPGFMIQGGCPLGKGNGGPGYLLKQEFNKTPHRRGVLSMARTADPNSAGSQFFLCVDDAPFLDNKYTAFGKITKGIEVADKIVQRPRDSNDRPKDPVRIKSVTVRVKGEPAAEGTK